MTTRNKRISLKDIAQEAGVSVSLVSIVLNGKAKQHRVSEVVAKRIRKIADKLGYRPNLAAKSLRDGRSSTIGVVVSDISNPFFANIARQIEATAEKYDYTVQFSSSDENSARMSSLIDSMLCRNIDGLIVVPSEGAEEKIACLISTGTPLVLLDRKIPELDCSYVCLDNWRASYDSAKHLISNGYCKIGVLAYDMKLQNMLDRVEGCRAAMRESGFEKNLHVRYADHTNMHKSCEKVLRQLRDIGVDALVFASNAIASECLRIIIGAGMHIPGDFAVVTFDGGSSYDFFSAPFTYIEQPIEIMAQKATEVLIEQIEHNTTLIQRIDIGGRLVIRESSAPKSSKPIF